MWINIGTIKEENKVWVEWFQHISIDFHHKSMYDEDIHNFLLTQLQNKAKADLKKSTNPTEDAKTWKPTFGRVKKSNIEKLADEIKKLSSDDKNELKGLF